MFSHLVQYKDIRALHAGMVIIIVVVVVVDSAALGGPSPPQANVAQRSISWAAASHFPQSSFLVSSLPRESILIPIGHVLVDLQDLSILS
jgi:hypothetical protein